LSSVQIPKCPALNTTDFIITIFHANTPPRARQQSSDVPSARTHNTVGERVVSPVLCASSTNTWTRSSSQSVFRKPQHKTKYNRTVATSSSHGNTSRGIHQRAEFSIVRHSSSRGILHRAASIIARYSPSRGIVIVRDYPSHGVIHRTASSYSSRGIIHRAASRIGRHSTSRGIVIVRHYPSRGIIIARRSLSRGIIIARYSHQQTTSFFVGIRCVPDDCCWRWHKMCARRLSLALAEDVCQAIAMQKTDIILVVFKADIIFSYFHYP
jgi:hypothetical protein